MSEPRDYKWELVKWKSVAYRLAHELKQFDQDPDVSNALSRFDLVSETYNKLTFSDENHFGYMQSLECAEGAFGDAFRDVGAELKKDIIENYQARVKELEALLTEWLQATPTDEHGNHDPINESQACKARAALAGNVEEK